MEPTFHSLADLSCNQISDLLNRAFEGYIVPIRFEPAMVAAMVRTEAIDLVSSLRARIGERDAGIALIARRGTVCRVAGMAVTPAARRKRVGRALMERVIADSRARGEAALTLEVIEQNPAAVGLYESVGLWQNRRLVGYSAHPATAEPADVSLLVEAEVSDAAREVLSWSPDLPWQISGETIAQLSLPNRAYRLGPAYAVVSDPAHEMIAIRALVVPEEQRRLGWGRRLVNALWSKHPDRQWRIAPVVPEGLADEFFAAVGFQREELSQLQMQMELSAGSNSGEEN
jgi:ribosomal protein S18 acetylase RimI-like enzyme